MASRPTTPRTEHMRVTCNWCEWAQEGTSTTYEAEALLSKLKAALLAHARAAHPGQMAELDNAPPPPDPQLVDTLQAKVTLYERALKKIAVGKYRADCRRWATLALQGKLPRLTWRERER